MVAEYDSIENLLRSQQPTMPVYCIYPEIYQDTARHFVERFPGRVLYAVKANDEPLVIAALNRGGVRHFDCASLPEVELVTSVCPEACCYLMNPVRIEGHAREAYTAHGVRYFMVDHDSGLAPLLQEIDAPECVIFARMAASHDSVHQDLSSKFGATPEEMLALLHAIRRSGAEPALAFNVGTGVMHPEAYVDSLHRATRVLEQLDFEVRLLDIGGGFPRSYPDYHAPPLDEYFSTIRGMRHELPLHDDGELLAEPGRALSAPGMSTLTKVLLRKGKRLFLNDGMYGAFWELRFRAHLKYPCRCYRGATVLDGDTRAFRLFGPSCDSSDEMPAAVDLPSDIDVGDYVEFGAMGAYSLSGRTRFNGFYSNHVVTIGGSGSVPPTV